MKNITQEKLPLHPRTWLRRCARLLLEEAGFGWAVHENREEALLAEELPAAAVFVTEESALETDLSPKNDDRAAELVVDVYAAGSGPMLDDHIDALSLLAEQAITFNAMERELARCPGHVPLLNLTYAGTALGVADDGARQVACAEISFAVEYRVMPAGGSLDAFVTGCTEWDLAGREGWPDGRAEAEDRITLPQEEEQ